MKKNTMQVIIIVLLVILIAMVFGFGIYYIASEKVDSNSQTSDSNTSITENENTDSEKTEPVTCSDCMNELIVSSEYNNTIVIEKKIVLGNKIKNLVINKRDKVGEDYNVSLSVDGKVLLSYPPSPSSGISQVHIFNEEVLFILDGDNNLHFYDANLNKLSVDTSLDSEYPNSMKLAFGYDDSTKVLSVKDNIITIIGARDGMGQGDITTEDKGTINVCAEPKTGELSDYVGQVRRARYEIKYLGNGKFSKATRMEIISRFDEKYCN